MTALTHVPSPSLEQGLRTHVDRIPINFEKAVQQHADYCQTLRQCGVTVQILQTNASLPDSVFIEDTAIVLDEIAMVTSMGASERRQESAAIELELKKHRPTLRIQLPATIEGGDVLCVGRKLIAGLSHRTNPAGIDQLRGMVAEFDYEVLAVTLRNCLHLKTGCCALPDGSLLVNEAWVDHEALRAFNIVPVPPAEPWAANLVLIGDEIITSSGHPVTSQRLRGLGFGIHEVDLSEFAKAEGGATCLSLLLNDIPAAARPPS